MQHAARRRYMQQQRQPTFEKVSWVCASVLASQRHRDASLRPRRRAGEATARSLASFKLQARSPQPQARHRGSSLT
jgi:hypothetical protein